MSKLADKELQDELEDEEGEMSEAPDGAWGWVVLVGAFVAYFIADGWSYSFGVFFPVFLRHFQESRGYTAIIGAMTHGVPRLVSPFVCAIINAVGCRTVTICGGLITALAFVLSAFATSIDYLCFTIGFLASIGFATIYIASLVIVTFYFTKRRGFATGLATTGSGLGAFIFPPIMELCLHTFSWRGTLLLVGGVCLHIVAAGALFRPPKAHKANSRKVRKEEITLDHDPLLSASDYFQLKLPVDSQTEVPVESSLKKHKQWNNIVSISSWSLKAQSNTSKADPARNGPEEDDREEYTAIMARSITEALDWTLCTNRQYLVFLASSFVFYLFVVVPYVYLVDMVSLLGYADSEAAILLSVIGIGRTIGQLVLGCLGDIPKVNSMLVYSVAISASGVATLLIPVSSNYLVLCFACAMFGFAVSCTYVLQMICVVQMVGLKRATNAFGVFQLIPGVATLIGTPLTGLMYEAQGDYEVSFYLAGSLIFVSGCVLLLTPCLKSETDENGSDIQITV
uniref:Major facilitator superfamily (MFS) profile domain-containing protein n=1 Tax=Capitella teleta TaxID=283909 RepID=X1ZGH9_CAPTE